MMRTWRQDVNSALGIISILVGLSILPAGPLPIGNMIVGAAAWLGLAIAPILLGVRLLSRS
jgi:hypothetical protein